MPLTRRELLKAAGVTAGAIGLTGLGYPNLVPYLNQPDNMVPGVSVWYATSCRECPAGCGMVLRSRESRVVKCEGNPEHPLSGGRLCARGQAALQGLYDPDRIKWPLRRHDSGDFRRAKWSDAYRDVGRILAGRPRIAFMTDLETGSLDALIRSWLTALGSTRLVVFEPIDYENVKIATQASYGSKVVPTFNIGASDYLVSFSADFLETWISPVEYARAFAAMRRIRNGARGRFVYVGPRVSMTAANADQRIIVPPGAEAAVGLAILSELGTAGVPGGFSVDEVARRFDLNPSDIRSVARSLGSAKAPLALPGGDVETARTAMLFNRSRASTLVNPSRPHATTNTASRDDVRSLISAMEGGTVDVLFIYRTNPVYSIPENARFVDALKRVKTVVSLSSFMDETTAYANWILPSNTPLESWGDYLPYPDVANLMQPTMGNMYDTRETGDILIELVRRAGVAPGTAFTAANYYGFVRQRWGIPLPLGQGAGTPNPGWESLLQRGGRWTAGGQGEATPNTGYETVFWNVPPAAAGGTPPTAGAAAAGGAAPGGAPVPILPSRKHEIRLWAYPNIYMYDGRHANKRWLQEMPEPVTKAAWDTWAEMHPSTADRLGVETEDLVEISHGGAKVSMPVYVWQGVSPDTVAVGIGRGHSRYGRFAEGVGANIWPLLDTDSPVVAVSKAGGSQAITRWKGSETQMGRDIAQTVSLGRISGRPELTMPLPSGYTRNDFYPGHEHSRGRWAMVVDTDRCIGCWACSVACYAENNLAVVGADGIRRKREMAWVRIDPYVDWRRKSAPIVFQPMLCQHCDAAPCEPVCPVYAAVHSEDGLNEQIYNRCVGTRYCSNNCPYKVRRFNWFDYQFPEPLNYQLNPDVTVRSRGVMEKCTFCVQRIREARIVALREGRILRDGEITPACVQTCPTGVYTFGDLMDPNSRVSQIIRSDPRAYQVLHELNTKTAVIYLKRVIERP